MRIYLVRHGQTEWNARGIAQGHTDTELDDTGREQADRLAARLKDQGVRSIFSSDLKRCVQTVQPLANAIGAQVQATPLLRERTFGDLEGQPWNEVGEWIEKAATKLGVPRHQVAPNGGESWQHVWDRIGTVIPTILQAPGPTVVVSHGGTCRQILCRLTGQDISRSQAYSFYNASVTELVPGENGHWIVSALSDVSHLGTVDEEQTR